MEADGTDIEETIGFKRPCTYNIGGTVKPYHVHLLFIKGEAQSWPRHISSYDRNFNEIKSFLKVQNLGFKIKYSLCERDDTIPQSDIQLLCFQASSMTQIGLSIDMLPDLANYLKTGEKGRLAVSKLQEDYYILICAHRAKDSRCGHCGAIIAEEFMKQSMTSCYKTQVYKVSHVGKHEYAANVITYPSGDWYGYVKPADVPRILTQLTNTTAKPSTELGDIWRGSMYLSIEEQIAISPKAVLATSSRIKVLKRKAKGDWEKYGFGPVGNDVFNDYLWLLFWILLVLVSKNLFFY